jgi:hypothetical protein
MSLTQQFTAGTTLTAQKLNESSVPVVSSTSDIGAPFAGQLVFNTTDTRLWRYTGSAWVVFTGGPVWDLSRGTAQSIPNITWTTLNWTEEDADTGNMHPASGDTVVINQPGLFSTGAKSSHALNATGIRACRLTMNGTADANTIKGTSKIETIVSAAGIASAATPTKYVQCALNDVLRAQTFQSSGGALNTSVASLGDQPLFNGTWLRD